MEVAGRKARLYILSGSEYVAVAGVKTKSLTINNEPIDVTTDDDLGWRKLLEADSGVRSVDIKVEGIAKDGVLSGIALNETAVVVRYIVPGILQVDGTFKLNGYESGAEVENGVTFSTSLMSSGVVSVGPVTPESSE